MLPERFNVRVYGIWIKDGKVLVSHERSGDLAFTKFPGGGLEFGEGVLACLHREFMEELHVTLDKCELFYINEDPVVSAFNTEEQLISIYYIVESVATVVLEENEEMRWNKVYVTRPEWVPIENISESLFYFPVDKIVANKIADQRIK